MQDFSPKTSKADILRGLMRNPDHSRLIKEAVDSPIGSTSRQKAKKIFSIMSKLHASRDGMGGPGMMYDQMAYGQMPAPENNPIEVNGSNSKNMVIFHKIPKPNINFTNTPGNTSRPNPRPTSLDGAGGPGRYDGKGGFFDSSSTNIFDNPNPYGVPDQSFDSSPTQSFPTLSNMYSSNTPQSSPTPVSAPKPATTLPSQLAPINQRVTQLRSIFAPNGSDPYGNTNTAIREQLFKDGYDYQDISNIVGSGQDAFDKIESGFGAFFNSLTGQKQPTPMYHPGYDQWGRPYASSAQPNPYVLGSTTQNPQYNNIDPTTGLPSTTSQNSGTNGPASTAPAGSSGAGSAAINYSKALGGANMNMSLADAIAKYGIDMIVDRAIIPNEGKSLISTNPGNIIYIGAPGQLHSGIKNAEGNEVAAYGSVAAGRQAIKDIVTNAASGRTGSYGPNPTLLSFANTYTNTGSSKTGLTGLSATAQNSVDQSTGAGMFAFNELMNPNDPLTHGQTLTQMEQGTQKNLWDKYDIGGLQDQINQLKNEGATLPRDVTDYITARDQYLKQTDSNISSFISTAMEGSAMSNPVNAANAQAHLNYLYTLRGRQNQSYIGYLTDAVNQHQADLDNVTNLYGTALNSYNAELTGTNNVTEKQYTMYAQALSDMYTAVDGAPAKLQQALLNNANLIMAQAQAATDPLKQGAQSGLISQGKQIEQYWGWDGSKEITSGIDLVKTLQDFSTLEPSIQPVNVIQTYANDIEKYIGQPNDNPGNTASSQNSAVTSSKKKQLLEAAITQFAHLSIAFANDSTLVLAGQQEAQNMASHLAGQVGGSLTPNAPKWQAAIKTLNPTGWFASKQPPTEAQFIANVAKAVGNTSDNSIASAVYKAFQRYLADGGTPEGAVNSLLFQTSSTTTKSQPFSDDQFAQNIGNIYAQGLIQGAFATQ